MPPCVFLPRAMATSITEAQAREKFWTLYRETFDSLYRYCARRATTKPVIAFIIKSLYEYALDEIRHGEEIILVDLYKWAYEFFAVQSQPKKGSEMMQQIKRIHDFRDVYDIKTDASSRAIRREQILENFYHQLEFKEREVLWLTFFEELTPADRAYVMGMSEEECTKFFYESLKKAKSVVSIATSDQKGFGRFAAYFGGVSSLLKKARQHEELDVDQEIYTSLRGLFMDQFARNPQPATPSGSPGPMPQPAPVSSEPQRPVESPVRPVQPETPVSARAQVRPISSVTSAPASSKIDQFDDESEWGDEGEGFGSGIWRRLQGVLVLLLVVGLGSFGYIKFFSVDARVNRLLSDERIVFSSDFKPEDKTQFAEEALLYLARNRDYTSVRVERATSNAVQVRFDVKDTGIEQFLLYPEVQTFDYKFRWQPKQYMKIKTVG